MTELLDNFMCRCGVEDVVLHRDILVIELMKQAQRWHVFGSRSISRFTKFLCDFLLKVSLVLHDPLSLQQTNL